MSKKTANKIIIFDLDGTLIHSIPDMCIAMNKTLKQFKLNANEVFTAYSRTVSFKTGRVPGNPQTTGSICVLGASPKAVDADVNILLFVLSCT